MEGLIEWRIGLDGIAQVLVVLLSVAAVLYGISVQKRRDREIAMREIYQQLELASIDLFRFEADHLELISPLYSGNAPPTDPAAFHAYRNYVCQILNLFEMAVEMCCGGSISDDIFTSWIEWFRELGQAPGFAPLWNRGLRDHYTGKLQKVMDLAAGEVDTGFRQQVMDLMNGQRV